MHEDFWQEGTLSIFVLFLIVNDLIIGQIHFGYLIEDEE